MVRLLLVVAALVLLTACAGGDDASLPTATPSPSATPTRTATPTPRPTRTPTPTPVPELDLSSSQPRQGGFLFVRLLHPGAASEAQVSFDGESYDMLTEGGTLYAVIGLSTIIEPGKYPLEVTAGGGSVASETVTVKATEFAREDITLPPDTAGLLNNQPAIEEEKQILQRVYSGFTPDRLWSGPWIVPVEGGTTNPFGLLRSINGGPATPHTGTDIAADATTPVAASASGRVAYTGYLFLRGQSVIIDQGAGVFSGYHHLQTTAVKEGQAITKGDLVGYVGQTGLVSGPHLHWEAIVNSVRVDPMLFTLGPIEP